MSELIPLEVLLGNPERVMPRISPDGTTLGYIAPRDGVLNVWLMPADGGDARCVTDDTDRGIRSFQFCHDGRHLLYAQDRGGDENWRVYTVDLQTGETVDRTPFDDVQAQPIAHRKRFPHEVLLGLNKDDPQLHDVYHLDLRTGALEKIIANPGFLGWVADNDLVVRATTQPQPDGSVVFLVRDTAEDDWRPLVTFDRDDALTAEPIGFDREGTGLYCLSSKEANATRLVRIDVASGDVEVIAADPSYDVVGALIHPDTRAPQLAFVQRDRLDHIVLDPSISEDVTAIAKVSDGDVTISDRDHADRTWLLAALRDDGPVAYSAYDRTTRTATHLFDHRSDLNDYDLQKMDPVVIPSRDGLDLHAYLTFPRGERRDLPTVLNVHGGPWGRDTWGYNPEAQWFADRGYLCVQVNFRGSTGYGKAFLNAGDKEWGGKMQDDLTDTVGWLVEQGYADPQRVAIFGGSYGGYAALAGATFTPDLYRCAVSIVGPSNLKTLIETIPPYWAPMIAMFKTRVGDPETEEDFLWSRSPLSKVDDIAIPMLIAHGRNDPRVKLAETEQIVAAMEAKGIDHDLMVFDDEGHGFAKPTNRLRFYEAAERFLAAHLGGRSAP